MGVQLRSVFPSGKSDSTGSGSHYPEVALFEADGHVRPMQALEADIIRMAIIHYGGQMSEVARRLGIGRSTLYRKLSELGIDHRA